MRLIPLGDKVIVQRIESETTSPGGIVLPDAAQSRPNEGRVLSVGQGRVGSGGEPITPQVQEGDRVIFSQYGGTEISLDGQDVLILTESDILAIRG